ncbi:hypothetical protein G7043_39445 [Lentzea sp. NEAU-D13]|uniref:Uncharacterized protein n=1 Tax=Lentzea alba TaxID=2714351 RepID=A0A7C9RX21_9PSEU|nr:hypothetical protein [Lentzea alba]NGY65007.1 hypothetical protein [Lentzea alba]
MSTPLPTTRELVLKYATTVAAGFAFWGTVWNLVYDRFLYRFIKICVGDVDPGNLSSLNTCKPISHVSWVLIVSCAVLGAGLAVGHAVERASRAGQSTRAAPGRPGPQVSPFAVNPPWPATSSAAGRPAEPPPARDRFAFFGDKRLVGLWTLCGVLVGIIQIFFR